MESMNSSPKLATSGQIGRLEEIYGDGLKEAQLISADVQAVIADKEAAPAMVKELVAVTRKYVEARGNIIVRRTKVNRKLAPQQMLDNTDRNQFTDKAVVDSMPAGEGEEVDVYFFKVGRNISDAELEKEYAFRGLKPDPWAQCRVNTDDPAFADEHPNGCHWQDADGQWCFLAFGQWRGDRRVCVSRRGDGWHDFWFFAGVRK